MSCSYDWSLDPWSAPRISGDREIVTGLKTPVIDFISFLAIAQALKIRFLPIPWDEARNDIGSGGTGRISQALANIQASFAFKRVRDTDKREDDIFQALANEITILSHDTIREHSNIVQLQGLSWDIRQPYDKPWPALIFEKTDFGDMYNFASLPIGRQMSFDDRIKLCVDVGQGIIGMHSNGIIHGDIKPQNVLIFKEESGRFCAKVTDFGYSTRFLERDYRVKLPRSPPWDAPEYRASREWAHSQAAKLDIFSYGLLCFWLLFEPRLSQNESFSPDCGAGSVIVHTSTLKTLERIKNNHQIGLYVRECLEAESTLDETRRRDVQEFLRRSLMENPQEREADLRCLLQMLDERLVSNHNILGIEAGYLPPVTEIKIESSIYDFYRCDYRVRPYIFQKVLEASQRSVTFAMQLAFCYHIGFGIPRNEIKSAEILAQCGLGQNLMLEMISGIPEEEDMRSAVLLERMYLEGFLQGVSFADLDREKRNIAEQQLLQEIRDLTTALGEEDSLTIIVKTTVIELYRVQKRWKLAEELELGILRLVKRIWGEDHHSSLLRMHSLAYIYLSQGRWTEANDVLEQVYQGMKRARGEEHEDTLTCMANLAQIYHEQGKRKEAEELTTQVIKIREKTLGTDHRFTLAAMANLAATYEKQDRFMEAEELLKRTIAAKERVVGLEHPSTLISMSNLGHLHYRRGQLDKADRLLSQTIETRRRVIGEEHPDTLLSMAHLAGVKRAQGRWGEAENLSAQVLETMKRVLGEDHPFTLGIMGVLASIYGEQSRHEEARKLEVDAFSAYERILGEENPYTLNSMNNLATTYNALGRLKEADELRVRVLEISKRVLGEDHSDTLIRLANLASTRRHQGLWEEAETMELHVIETMKRVLGEDHPNTIIVMSNLASMYAKQGRWTDAEKLLVEVVRLSEMVLGNDHPETQEAIMLLEFVRFDQGRGAEETNILKAFRYGEAERP